VQQQQRGAAQVCRANLDDVEIRELVAKLNAQTPPPPPSRPLLEACIAKIDEINSGDPKSVSGGRDGGWVAVGFVVGGHEETDGPLVWVLHWVHPHQRLPRIMHPPAFALPAAAAAALPAAAAAPDPRPARGLSQPHRILTRPLHGVHHTTTTTLRSPMTMAAKPPSASPTRAG